MNENEAATAAEKLQHIQNEISKVLIGQLDILEAALISLVTSGHILVEGLPGLGKTLLIRALAQAIGGKSKRIQFTPDLLPNDITGHVLFDMKADKFRMRRGPVFTNILLADEINRAPAKTQAALLEAMQEYQVSIEGKAHSLPRPFLTLATQNPLEHEGTYPLPDAQLDRFLMKVIINYPVESDETEIVKSLTDNKLAAQLDVSNISPACDISDIRELQKSCASVTTDEKIIDYAVSITRKTRNWPGLATGSGPRGSIALIRAAKGKALLEGRHFVIPDDVKELTGPVLRHRVLLSPDMELEGRSVDMLLDKITQSVKAPRK